MGDGWALESENFTSSEGQVVPGHSSGLGPEFFMGIEFDPRFRDVWQFCDVRATQQSIQIALHLWPAIETGFRGNYVPCIIYVEWTVVGTLPILIEFHPLRGYREFPLLDSFFFIIFQQSQIVLRILSMETIFQITPLDLEADLKGHVVAEDLLHSLGLPLIPREVFIRIGRHVKISFGMDILLIVDSEACDVIAEFVRDLDFQ